jgi:hypothetical protein
MVAAWEQWLRLGFVIESEPLGGLVTRRVIYDSF